MLTIDLLPPEHRRAERTAPALFLATIGLVALFCSASAACAWVWFNTVGGARSDVATAQEIFDTKKPQADYSDNLEKEKKDYTQRMDHIRDFSDSRILWTKKLDQLASLVDTPSERDRHVVWFQGLTMKMEGTRDQGLALKGKSSTGFLKKLSDFNTDLQKMPFAEEFSEISPPAGKVVHDKDYEPTTALEFEVALALRERGDGKDKTGKPVKK